MAASRRNVLVVGVDPVHYERFAPLLRRADLDVDRVPSAAGAIALVNAVGFDVVIVHGEVVDAPLVDVVRAVRRPGGPSLRASVMVLATAASLAAAQELVGHGVNRVVEVDGSPERIQELVAVLLRTAPRLAVRLPARLDVQVGAGVNRLFCQTENMSASGMLVRMPRNLPLGEEVDFEVYLPGEREALEGTGKVVRHTRPDRENAVGVGMQFTAFKGDGRRRLSTCLDTLLAQRSVEDTR